MLLVRICERRSEWARKEERARMRERNYLLPVDYAGYLERQLTLHLLNSVFQPFSLRGTRCIRAL
jgi:hypothetical protein